MDVIIGTSMSSLVRGCGEITGCTLCACCCWFDLSLRFASTNSNTDDGRSGIFLDFIVKLLVTDVNADVM